MPAALPLRSDFYSQTLPGLARRCEDPSRAGGCCRLRRFMTA